MRATNAGRTLANVLRPRPDREPLDDEHHHLILFERWTQRFLPTIDDAGDRRTITMFASWHERRRLTRSIEIGTLRTWSTRCARQRIGQGAVFLAWLRDDQQTTLTSCNQTNIDTWFSTGNLGRQSAVAFIVWAKTQQLCDRRLRITPIKPATPPSMPRAERIALIARLITDIDLRLDVRVAGLLVALYAQPTSRICRIRRDAITITEAGIELKIGPRPIEPVEPFGALLQQLVGPATTDGSSPATFPASPAAQTPSAYNSSRSASPEQPESLPSTTSSSKSQAQSSLTSSATSRTSSPSAPSPSLPSGATTPPYEGPHEPHRYERLPLKENPHPLTARVGVWSGEAGRADCAMWSSSVFAGVIHRYRQQR